MGMVNKCECDACGKIVEAGRSIGGESLFPPDWHVLHWQQKNSNHTGNGYVLLGLISYCPECGDILFKNAKPARGTTADFGRSRRWRDWLP